jgi:hypothetical protein
VERDPPLENGDVRGHTVRWALTSAAQGTSNASSSRLELNSQGPGDVRPALVDLRVEDDYPRSAWDPTAGDEPLEDPSVVGIDPPTPAAT